MRKNRRSEIIAFGTVLLCMLCVIGVVFISSSETGAKDATNSADDIYATSKPYTRWWWFASVIEKKDIKDQLKWLKKNNFGGVEIAFIYPPNRDPEAKRIGWLSPEWTEAVTYAKEYADSIGLGCDFTFGTLWPFGGTFVSDADRAKVYGDPDFKQPLRLSWTHPEIGNVIDHMDRHAFERYADVMARALLPALKGTRSGLFCDSWEVETKQIWTDGFDTEFEKRYGYDIKPYMETIYAPGNKDQLYDYMKLVAEYVLNGFYRPFTKKCHELNSFSRVQCAGSPTDLISAYAAVDVPETEAMLYEPAFSAIVASAAALSGKPVISAETFTCIYGFPDAYLEKEQTADLKLVADALFANGVNQIIWHGMPYNPEGVSSNRFYATVHVSPDSSFADELPRFNEYLTTVSKIMRKGRAYSDIAVYLPLEDAWMAGEYPKELQMKWSWGAYEMRYVCFPEEVKRYHPLWINGSFLKQGIMKGDRLSVGNLSFSLLYVDVQYLDAEALDTILACAQQGLPVCLKRDPRQPGKHKSERYAANLKALKSLKNVSSDFQTIKRSEPLIGGGDTVDYWCRIEGDDHYIFFTNPKSERLKYPLGYGQSFTDTVIRKAIIINIGGASKKVLLKFEPYQSIIVKVDRSGKIQQIDIPFQPKIPKTEK